MHILTSAVSTLRFTLTTFQVAIRRAQETHCVYIITGHCTYSVTVRRVCAIIVVVEEQ